MANILNPKRWRLTRDRHEYLGFLSTEGKIHFLPFINNELFGRIEDVDVLRALGFDHFHFETLVAVVDVDAHQRILALV